MKKSLLRVVVLVLCVLMAAVFAFVGCKSTVTETTASAGTTVAAQEELYVLVCDWQGDPVLKSVRFGMQKAAEFWTALGQPIKAEWVGAMEGNPDKVYTDLEATIAKNPAGIIYDPSYRLNEAPLVEPYLNAGGMIFGYGGNESPDWQITGVIGTENYKFGTILGKKAIELFGENVKVGVYTVSTATNHIARVNGIKDIFKNYPNAEIVGTMEEGQSNAEGIQNVSAFLMAHPDIDGFIGTTGSSNNIGTALKEAGVPAGEKFVIGSDINDEIFNQIESGYVTGTVAQQFASEGFYAVTIMHLRKMDPAPITANDETLMKAGFLPGPYNIIMDNPWIDKSNLSIWKQMNMDQK